MDRHWYGWVKLLWKKSKNQYEPKWVKTFSHKVTKKRNMFPGHLVPKKTTIKPLPYKISHYDRSWSMTTRDNSYWIHIQRMILVMGTKYWQSWTKIYHIVLYVYWLYIVYKIIRYTNHTFRYTNKSWTDQLNWNIKRKKK